MIFSWIINFLCFIIKNNIANTFLWINHVTKSVFIHVFVIDFRVTFSTFMFHFPSMKKNNQNKICLKRNAVEADGKCCCLTSSQQSVKPPLPSLSTRGS